MSSTEEPVRWLHLSDFHVGKDPSAQQRLFRDLLVHIKDKIVAER